MCCRSDVGGFAGRLFWSSQLWFSRPERFALARGDSAIGYRIPTELMPFVAPDELDYDYEDLKDEVGEKQAESCRSDRHDAWTFFEKEPVPDPLPAVKAAAETSKELIRPSLCLQIREGRLHVFLPYISAASDYLELVSAVEDTCASICKCRCGSKVIHHRLICAYDQLQPNPRPRGS